MGAGPGAGVVEATNERGDVVELTIAVAAGGDDCECVVAAAGAWATVTPEFPAKAIPLGAEAVARMMFPI